MLIRPFRLHMFYTQRLVDIPDGLPKWTGINKDSELMADTDIEVVKERERKRQREHEAENDQNGAQEHAKQKQKEESS